VAHPLLYWPVMRRLIVFLAVLLAVPSSSQALVRLTKDQAKQEIRNNVPKEIRGTYWAYPGKGGKLTAQRLLGKGAKASDVAQGELNNCFFVSTISEIAAVKPDKIAALFPRDDQGQVLLDKQGRVAVDLFKRTRSGLKKERQWVSSALVYKEGKHRPRFSWIANDKLWAPVLEKAYAQQLAKHGRIKGLNALNQGGTVEQVIEAITGDKSTYRDVVATRQGTEHAWEFLKTATGKGEIVVAGTPEPRSLGKRRATLIEDGVLAQATKQWTWKNQRMIDDHDQAVLGVREVKGQRLVRLRNPWSSYVPRGAGRNRGEYEIPLEKFMLFFDSITHSGGQQAGDGPA
jgi:hypothetical protein